MYINAMPWDNDPASKSKFGARKQLSMQPPVSMICILLSIEYRLLKHLSYFALGKTYQGLRLVERTVCIIS